MTGRSAPRSSQGHPAAPGGRPLKGAASGAGHPTNPGGGQTFPGVPQAPRTGTPAHPHHHDHHHAATPWPEARAIAAQAGRMQHAARMARFEEPGPGERGSAARTRRAAPTDRSRQAVQPGRPDRPGTPGRPGDPGHSETAGTSGQVPPASAALRHAHAPTAPGAQWTPLDAALGLVTAAPLIALTDLPSFDSSAMDGWTVAGPGPWLLDDQGPGAKAAVWPGGASSPARDTRGLLAGHEGPDLLGDGNAIPIATGARIPHDATAVIRSEHGHTDHRGRLYATREVVHGQDIRPRGQECRKGDRLLPDGVVITPAVLGLAAAAGYDALPTVPRPCAEVLILGDELLTEGLPREGLIRDALGPMLPHWLNALGVEVTAVRRLGDDARALHRAVTGSRADLLVTTGGTASGPVDHVHPTLTRVGAELLVDGVAVRPGHPMLLARTGEQQHLVGLPGNPLAAVSGLLTLAEPLIRALRGLDGSGATTPSSPTFRTSPSPSPSLPSSSSPSPLSSPSSPSRSRFSGRTAVVRDAVQGHPRDTRLVPVGLSGGDALPLHFNGPAMLRGVAAADALAVVPPGGAEPGDELDILDLPWARGGIGALATGPS